MMEKIWRAKKRNRESRDLVWVWQKRQYYSGYFPGRVQKKIHLWCGKQKNRCWRIFASGRSEISGNAVNALLKTIVRKTLYSYDKAGNLVQQRLPNGRTVETDHPMFRKRQTWDMLRIFRPLNPGFRLSISLTVSDFPWISEDWTDWIRWTCKACRP